MFGSIGKGFKALDDFLTACEEYVAQRVWNGKFINDIRFLSITTIENIKKTFRNIITSVRTSSIFTALASFFQKFAKLLMQIQIVEDIILLIGEGLRLCIKYFAHYLIILITGLASAFLLLMTFKYALILFLVLFIPVIYLNHLFLSSFFVLVEKKEAGVRFSLGNAINHIRLTLSTNTFVFALQIALAVTSGIFLLGFSFLLSYLFGFINIAWSSSFLYWLPVVMLSLFLSILLYVAEVTLSFSYHSALKGGKTVLEGLSDSYYHLQTNPRHSILFYILLTFASIFFIGIVSTTNYEGGFVLSVLFTSHAFLFLGFLLQRKYFTNIVPIRNDSFVKLRAFFKPTLAIGVVSYLMTAGLMIQLQPDIMTFIDEQRPTIAASYEYTKYRNSEAGYSIDYPKPWSIYRWDNFSTTIYTNVTGTEAGGIKMNIDVRSDAGSPYFSLYEANPGLITYDTGTKNVTTKIANVIINEKNAVKYTYTKTDANQTEFQTHYLIHYNEKVYDIAFVTVSKKIETAYSAIFDRMLDSFVLEAK